MRGLTLYGQTGKFTYRMLMTVLIGQSLAVFFGALVARGIAAAQGDARGATYLWVGVGLALLAIAAAGTMRRPYGVTLGWLVQVGTFVAGVVLPMMVVVGVIFLAMWVTCLVQGAKIDGTDARRRAEAAGGAEPDRAGA